MNTHLSEQAMLRWHAGEASELERRHVAECAGCQERLAPMTHTLQWFSNAARQWGGERAAMPRRAHATLHRWSRLTMAAALACLLLVATGLTALHWAATPTTPVADAPRQRAQPQIPSDDALLEAVDQDVSHEVPEALEPLSWNAGTGKIAARQ